MIVPNSIQQAYDKLHPSLFYIKREVERILLPYCEEHGFPTISRLKTIESLCEKIETGRFQKLSDIDDLFGITIIVPTLSIDPIVIEYCRQQFRIDQIKTRTTKKSPEHFRFDATRLSCRLVSGPGEEPPEEDVVFKIRFEIQVRTALEHAWSVATHPLVYKTDEVSWSKQRLAAQLKASLESIDTQLLAFNVLAKSIGIPPWPDIEDKIFVISSFEKLFADRRIPSELRPKDFSRFAENFISLVKLSKRKPSIRTAVEALTEEIRKTRYDLVPRSLSLLQYFYVLLIRLGHLDGKSDRYVGFASSESIALFPEIKEISPAFEVDL